MNKLKTLFLMQIKERFDFSWLKSKKLITFKVIFSLLGFAVITALAYLAFFLCQFLNLFSAANYIPLAVVSVIFFVMFVLNLLTCTVGLSKSLYFAKDNQMLLTFPVNANLLFISKIAVYYVAEIRRNFSFIIPVFIAYGIASSVSFVYFLWLPIMLTLFTLVTVLLAALLSLPIYFVLRFFSRFQFLKVALSLIFVGGVVALSVIAINAIPENINLITSWGNISKQITAFLNYFTDKFVVFYAITIFLCGSFNRMEHYMFSKYSYIVLLIILACIIVLSLLNYYISRPIYLKMASKQFEFDRKKTRKGRNITRNNFFSSCIIETKKTLRSSNVFTLSLATLAIAPVAILLLNAIFSAINTRLTGDNLVICFNVLIVLLFVLAHNISVSSIFSKDGDARIFFKTMPSSPVKRFLPYLLYNIVVSTIILVITSSLFISKANIGAGDGILLTFAMLFVVFAHIVWSAEFDFLHPRFLKDASSVNQNEVKSSILTFAISIIFFGLLLFFLFDGLKGVYLKFFLASFAFLVLRCYLFYYKAKVLYKEI